jgi:hypothetical protein
VSPQRARTEVGSESWIWITIVFGALFGIVAAAFARRRATAAG